MITLALVCDAVIGNVQEKYMKAYSATTHEVVLFSYAIGFVYLLIILLAFGDLHEYILVTINVRYHHISVIFILLKLLIILMHHD